MTVDSRIGVHPRVMALRWLAVVLLVVLAPAGTAHASCAEAPAPSSHHFEGLVVEVADQGYAARVLLDSGREVIVLGTGDRDRSDGMHASTDRRYAAGARYVFHPRNASSPYRDDACTATVHVTGPHPSAYDSRPDRSPSWLPIDEQAGQGRSVVVAGAALLTLAVTAAALKRRQRYPEERADRQ